MNEPQFTIRVKMTDVFHEGAFVAMRDVEAACQKHGVEMKIIEGKYFDFTTDDVKNFFFLGLKFPKQ